MKRWAEVDLRLVRNGSGKILRKNCNPVRKKALRNNLGYLVDIQVFLIYPAKTSIQLAVSRYQNDNLTDFMPELKIT